jgi:anion-transporting  ArsA/GET3 family ATPase
MEEARAMFRDKDRTEFVVVTIPTQMAMAESERLAAALEKEHVPCKRIIVNQLVRPRHAHVARMRTAYPGQQLLAVRIGAFREAGELVECRWTRQLQISSCTCGEQINSAPWACCAQMQP